MCLRAFAVCGAGERCSASTAHSNMASLWRDAGWHHHHTAAHHAVPGAYVTRKVPNGIRDVSPKIWPTMIRDLLQELCCP